MKIPKFKFINPEEKPIDLKELQSNIKKLDRAVFGRCIGDIGSFLSPFLDDIKQEESRIDFWDRKFIQLERKLDLLMKHLKLEFLKQSEHPDFKVINERSKKKKRN